MLTEEPGGGLVEIYIRIPQPDAQFSLRERATDLHMPSDDFEPDAHRVIVALGQQVDRD